MTANPAPSVANPPVLRLLDVSKHFTLHHRAGAHLPVFSGVDLELHAGECLVLDGPSGAGKSTLLKLVYASYRATAGQILVHSTALGRTVDVTRAEPRDLLTLRQQTVGYVSQFLRVIPRVAALDVVAEPLLDLAGDDPVARAAALDQARQWLTRLRIPERLWHLPPATFSGGEQQRINIARSMIRRRPLMLMDEPTASLDAANAATVVALMQEAMQAGSALLGIFHDAEVAAAVSTRRVDVAQFRSGA